MRSASANIYALDHLLHQYSAGESPSGASETAE
jgi:hypothetical protein